MLSGKISSEDEDEVEDELAAMEREARGIHSMPEAPSLTKDELPDAPNAVPQTRKNATRQRAADPIAA
jgi:charged multivesicular body protein 6